MPKKAAKAAAKEEPTPLVTPTIRAEPIDSKTGKPIDTKPADLKDYKGSYKYKFSGDPDERYGLKVVEDAPDGMTHHLKSNDHYWNGTEAQFKEQFD